MGSLGPPEGFLSLCCFCSFFQRHFWTLGVYLKDFYSSRLSENEAILYCGLGVRRYLCPRL